MHSVVVTGIGCVSAAGVGADKLWHAAVEGQSQIGTLKFERSPRQRITAAAHLSEFDPAILIDKDVLRYCDRFTQFALFATHEALTQAGLLDSAPFGSRTAVIIGTGIGGANTTDDGHYNFYVGHGREEPMGVPRVMPNAAASQTCIKYGCTGPSFAVSSACSSAAQSIGIGFQMVQAGMVDRAIVGGSEAILTPSSFRAWEVLRVLTPELCRPFSKDRSGMVLGEGAASFVIEAKDVAVQRGANILCEIAGYGTTTDAHDIVRPQSEGQVSCMQQALDGAGISPEQIGYINAHGTGTVLNDIVETAAVKDAFGSYAERVPISSTKPIHGHTLGAAGGLELAITIHALRENVAPPTINWKGADPRCDLNMVPNEAKAATIDYALSNSFAFGGINATLVVKKHDSGDDF